MNSQMNSLLDGLLWLIKAFSNKVKVLWHCRYSTTVVVREKSDLTDVGGYGPVSLRDVTTQQQNVIHVNN